MKASQVFRKSRRHTDEKCARKRNRFHGTIIEISCAGKPLSATGVRKLIDELNDEIGGSQTGMTPDPLPIPDIIGGSWDVSMQRLAQLCAENEPDTIAELLRSWVQAGQPDGFAGSGILGCSWRAITALVAVSYGDRYGGHWDYIDFYEAMCGARLMTTEERMVRHKRLGLLR